MNTRTARCPDCGAAVDAGREGCQLLFDTLSQSGALPNAAFDAYCMQHLERYCKSGKSYAAHLTRLCCGMEHNSDAQVFSAIQRWLNGNVAIEKPTLLASVGRLTIADVAAAQDTGARAQVAQEWVDSVWLAYASQQELARRWIREAVAARHHNPKRR